MMDADETEIMAHVARKQFMYTKLLRSIGKRQTVKDDIRWI